MDRTVDSEGRVLRYDPTLGEKGVRAGFDYLERPELLIDDDGQKYGASGCIGLPSWREVILAVRSIEEADPRNIEFMLTTSYAVQARKAAYVADPKKAQTDFPFVPCTVIGVPHTIDGKIICGIRGGSTGVGKADIAGGYLTTNLSGRHPVFDSLGGELADELGLFPSEMENLSLIGRFNDGQFNTLCFITDAHTSLSANETIERHREAYSAYQKAKQRRMGEMSSRKAISDAGHVAIDAWEHEALFTIPNDREHLQGIVESNRVTYGGREYEPLKNMIAALRIIVDGCSS